MGQLSIFGFFYFHFKKLSSYNAFFLTGDIRVIYQIEEDLILLFDIRNSQLSILSFILAVSFISSYNAIKVRDNDVQVNEIINLHTQIILLNQYNP